MSPAKLKSELKSPASFAASMLSYDVGCLNLEISKKGKNPGMELLLVPTQIMTKTFGFQMAVCSSAANLSS